MKKTLWTTTLATALATPALAHHPLNGMPMETFVHGLLSGVGHPVLGFDHLFFVLAVGVVAAFSRMPLIMIVSYLTAMATGCLLMAIGVGLPAKEVAIAVSLVAVGGTIAFGRSVPSGVWLAALAAFGLFHGSAFGDSIAGQEIAAGTNVLIGYLIGLAALQAFVAYAAGWSLQRLSDVSDISSVQARLAGAVVAGAGLFLVLEIAEGAAFAAFV